MNRIHNLSIRRKLQLAFLTVLLLCFTAGVIGAVGIGTVFIQSKALYTDFGQSQGVVNRLLADFKQNQVLTSTLLLQTEGQEEVLEALTANRTALAQISLGLEQISAVVQHNSATSQQSAAVSQELYAQAEQLARHVSSFTLS